MGVEAQPMPEAGPVQGAVLTSGTEGEFKDGLCYCCNQCSPTCLSAYLCQPCMVARFYDQFVKRGTYSCVLVSLILWGIFEFLIFGGTMWIAGLFSTFLGFYFLYQGDPWQDCCVSLWCYCCTIGQMYRHIRRSNGWVDRCHCNELGPVPDSDVMIV